MQIKCHKDSAAWFDELSIMEVKCVIRKIGLYNDRNYIQLYNELIDNIGLEKVHNIIRSPEYDDLYRLNKEIFNLIDLLRVEKVKKNCRNYELLSEYGVEIDNKNTDRFEAKKKLQEKFFKSEIREVKL